jgi:hypothetical protein
MAMKRVWRLTRCVCVSVWVGAAEREALAATAGRVASLRAKFNKGVADSSPAPVPQFNRRLVSKGE